MSDIAERAQALRQQLVDQSKDPEGAEKWLKEVFQLLIELDEKTDK